MDFISHVACPQNPNIVMLKSCHAPLNKNIHRKCQWLFVSPLRNMRGLEEIWHLQTLPLKQQAESMCSNSFWEAYGLTDNTVKHDEGLMNMSRFAVMLHTATPVETVQSSTFPARTLVYFLKSNNWHCNLMRIRCTRSGTRWKLWRIAGRFVSGSDTCRKGNSNEA